MSLDTTSNCCYEEYQAAYEKIEAAVRAADELEVALEMLKNYMEEQDIKSEMEYDQKLYDDINKFILYNEMVLLKDWPSIVEEGTKDILDEIETNKSDNKYGKRRGKNRTAQLNTLIKNVENKKKAYKAAKKACEHAFIMLLRCTAKYEPKMVNLNFADFTNSEIHYHGGSSMGFGDPIRHKEYACKCQAQLERKTPSPSLTDDFDSWFQYYRKSPEIGGIRDLICTYEGEAQAYIMVDKVELIPFDRLSNLKTGMQGGPATIHFDISWSKFQPCEPLKFNIRFGGEEKLHITFTFGSSCAGQTHDLVDESNRAIKLVMGLDPNKSYESLGELTSDSICRCPHKWTQKAERIIPDPEMGYAAWKAAMEINVYSSGP